MSPAAVVPGRVSVVVVNYNCAAYIGRTLASLREQTWPDLEAIVVDNGSTDGSDELVAREHPEALLVRTGGNPGFAEANNIGVARSSGEYVFMLNPDAWVEPETIGALAAALRDDASLGVVGGTVRHPDGTIQETGNRLDRFAFPVPRRDEVRASVERDTFFVGGCSLMIRRADWDRLGGLDGRFFMFCEEVDLCWRVQLSGRDVAVVSAAVIWHHGGVTLAGGYARGAKHATNPTRIYLRERNALAMVLRNGSRRALASAALGWAMNALEALGFLALRQPRVAAQYPRALLWNLRELPRTLRLRRADAPHRVRAERELRGWARGSGKLRVLRAGGVPRVEG
ncbi:MAG: hypothetical protein QOD86_1542 [Miltoncostaeaceae bacterium]|nr:hypothetical protein [Miltoncostaeaceae bacterium]